MPGAICSPGWTDLDLPAWLHRGGSSALWACWWPPLDSPSGPSWWKVLKSVLYRDVFSHICVSKFQLQTVSPTIGYLLFFQRQCKNHKAQNDEELLVSLWNLHNFYRSNEMDLEGVKQFKLYDVYECSAPMSNSDNFQSAKRRRGKLRKMPTYWAHLKYEGCW